MLGACVVLAALPLLAAPSAAPPVTPEQTDTTGWYPWAFPLDDPMLGELDLSRLLDAPAGHRGFIAARPDGHLYFADGTRARFFGTNVGGAMCCPDRATAELLAERLSRYGLNLLRLHTPDARWGGIIDYKSGASRKLDPAALDRYDYFVAELLKRGIYVYFDLLDYRKFMPGDEVRDAELMQTAWENSLKGASIFDDRLIELQQEYATQLLTHLNPYTGRRYVDEPGLAILEITNENSLFYLQNQKLMLPSYTADLTRRWNAWLVKRHGGRDDLAKAWPGGELKPDEDPAGGTVSLRSDLLYLAPVDSKTGAAVPGVARTRDLTRFLYELQTAYYDRMLAYLRGLGVKCPITGTNQDFSDASNLANTRCDVLTRNNYWQHPDVHAEPYVRYSNGSFLKADLARVEHPVANIASSTAVGKGMISPEFNFPWPNEWRAEALPVMAAYARLQDWDGLLYFQYQRPGQQGLDHFPNATDPVRWGQVPMAALVFLRGDVDVARHTVHVGVSREDVFSPRPRRTSDHYSPYRVLPFISKVRNAYFDEVYDGDADVVVASGHSASGDYAGARRAMVFADLPGGGPDQAPTLTDRLWRQPTAARASRTGADPYWLHRAWLEATRRWGLGTAPAEEAGRVFRSDTGQLVLDRERGVFTAATPRAVMATGFLAAAGPQALSTVTVDCRTPFASVTVVSLDGQPISGSQRLLLTAVARAENTGQATAALNAAGRSNADPAVVSGRRALVDKGQPPVLAEPVDARVTLTTDQPLAAWSLGPKGEQREPMPVTREGGRLVVELKAARSPWVLLAVERR